MQKPFFSIVVVSLNPGERLEKTLKSILSQTYGNYEVILKDGGSKDGSLELLKEAGFFEDKPMIKIIEQPDKSIYDGMNQAVTYVKGCYIQFLNCGDYFYDENVIIYAEYNGIKGWIIEDINNISFSVSSDPEEEVKVEDTIKIEDIELPTKEPTGGSVEMPRSTFPLKVFILFEVAFFFFVII